MYSKLEEITALEKIFSRHAKKLEMYYERETEIYKKEASKISANIKNSPKIIKGIEEILNRLKNYQLEYANTMSVQARLANMQMSYSALTNVQNSKELLEEKEKVIKLNLANLRQDEKYKSVYTSIANDLVQYHPSMNDFYTKELDEKLDEIESLYENKKISKEELIILTNACNTLSNTPEYKAHIEEQRQNRMMGSSLH